MKDEAHRRYLYRWAAFVLVALVGLAVRFPQLGARPMHTDEAVNAYIVGQVLAGEPFTYDPQDRHGPSLAAVAVPLARLRGAKSFSELMESELRLTSVAAGTITILLFGAAAEMFGFVPSLIAALLFALGPLPVYYDRDFIHEPLFCLVTLALILTAWRALKTNSVSQAALAGACAAVMLASKETAILHFFALGVAGVLFYFFNPRGHFSTRVLRAWPLPGAAVAAFVAVFALLFTWFGTNIKAMPALLHAVPDVLARAGGQGHEKPFWYYGRLLIGGWSGGLFVALACLGLFIGVKQRASSAYQWLAYYSLLLAAIYSLIPYKTPWLALNLWLPLAIFAAKAIEWLRREALRQLSSRISVPAFCVFAVIAAVVIAHDTRDRVFLHPADETNPYAYAQTTSDILDLPAEITDLAGREGIATPRIAVIASDPWPLPWYLRHFQQVGFWQPGQQVGDADYIITSTEASEQYADRLRNDRPEFYGVRPGVLILLWSREPK